MVLVESWCKGSSRVWWWTSKVWGHWVLTLLVGWQEGHLVCT